MLHLPEFVKPLNALKRRPHKDCKRIQTQGILGRHLLTALDVWNQTWCLISNQMKPRHWLLSLSFFVSSSPKSHRKMFILAAWRKKNKSPVVGLNLSWIEYKINWSDKSSCHKAPARTNRIVTDTVRTGKSSSFHTKKWEHHQKETCSQFCLDNRISWPFQQ